MTKSTRAHLFRAAVYAIVALAGMTLAYSVELAALLGEIDDAGATKLLLGLAGALVFLVGGVRATRSLARGLRSALGERFGDARAALFRPVVVFVGYILIALTFLQLLGLPIDSLLLGGAVGGIAIGIAAQQTLGNLMAGMLLLVVRPFKVGEHVILRSGPLAGEYEGTITDMGVFYVTMETAQGEVALPNAGVIAAAIGPGAKQAE